jgi:anti-anti-sigma factor
MSNEFEFDVYRKDADLMVVLRGRLVLNQCQDLKIRLAHLLTAEIDRAYLHLGDLTFLDSAGLGVLVGLKMQANRNRCQLVFLAPPRRIEEIFRTSKLDSIFQTHGGGEAEILFASLGQPAFLIWSDSKDARQAAYNTEYNTQGGDASARLGGSKGSLELSPDSPEGRIQQLCQQAIDLLQRGDLQKSVDAFRQALAINPDHVTALNNLAIVYEKRPEWYAQAHETWKRVAELSDRFGDTKHHSRAKKHIETLDKLMGK